MTFAGTTGHSVRDPKYGRITDSDMVPASLSGSDVIMVPSDGAGHSDLHCPCSREDLSHQYAPGDCQTSGISIAFNGIRAMDINLATVGPQTQTRSSAVALSMSKPWPNLAAGVIQFCIALVETWPIGKNMAIGFGLDCGWHPSGLW